MIFLLSMFAATVASAKASIIDCNDKFPTNVAICEDPLLKSKAELIDRKYQSFMVRYTDNLGFLIKKDLKFFTIKLHLCNNPLATRPQYASMADCLSSYLEEKITIFKNDVDKNDLIEGIADAGYIDRDLLEAYPDYFVNRKVFIFGTLIFTAAENGYLSGAIIDNMTRKKYPAIYVGGTLTDSSMFGKDGQCHYGCAGWWPGEFKRVGPDFLFTFSAEDYFGKG